MENLLSTNDVDTFLHPAQALTREIVDGSLRGLLSYVGSLNTVCTVSEEEGLST